MSLDFILGINYWPCRKAMGWWSDFDPSEVREEFAVIRAAGLGWVRIFLLWEDWQPKPSRVEPTALRHLETVCEAALQSGLKLDVTFFTGHMSGPSWAPGWMLLRDQPMPSHVFQVVSGKQVVNCGYLNPYTEPTVLEAEELLLRTVVSRFKDHPAIALWNLGNEPDLFAYPPDPASGRAWARRMTSLIKEIDLAHPVTCGLHAASLLQNNGLRINDIFAEVDMAVMHGYPMYIDWANGPLDPDFVPYLCSLTSALSGKPVLMEEFGGPTEAPGKPSSTWEWTGFGKPRRQYMPSEEDLAAYYEAVLPRLVETGALGAMLWCYADYVPDLWDRPPCDESWHERFFGLVHPDGSLKPHADVIRRFASTHPTVRPPSHRVVLDVSPEDYYRDPLGNARRLYRVYSDSAI